MSAVVRSAGVLVVVCVAACGGSGGSGPTAPVPTPPAVVQATPTPPPTTTSPSPNQTLVANLNVTPASGTIPLTIEANLCQSTNPGGVTLSYSFDFGDGATASDPFCRLTHTYTKVGPFNVTGCIAGGGASNCAGARRVTVSAADLNNISINTAKGCMIDVTVDVGGLALSRGIKALAVTQVNVTFRRSSSTTVRASRDGSSSRWLVRDQNIQPLGSGTLTVSAEAVDGGQTVGSGSRSANPTCP